MAEEAAAEAEEEGDIHVDQNIDCGGGEDDNEDGLLEGVEGVVEEEGGVVEVEEDEGGAAD